MGELGREYFRRKLRRLLSQCLDEDAVSLVTAVSTILNGDPAPLQAVRDLPLEAVGAKIGSSFYIAPWLLETLINELLAAPKVPGLARGVTRTVELDRFQSLRVMVGVLIKLENAEDGVFLADHDIFDEMSRLGQRQFPWQRGLANGPTIYRAMLLYGSGAAADHFLENAGITVADFVLVGAYLSRALSASDHVDRCRDLSELGIGPDAREAALRLLSLSHEEARRKAAKIRSERRHVGYSPSVLRDFPVIAFGPEGNRLRAPLPELLHYRYTSGLYLDVVQGGAAVWTGIGDRFEEYVLEYASIMMDGFDVAGEVTYGLKKNRYRSPDVLVSRDGDVLAAIECKAKRMSFDARFGEEPEAQAALGHGELAKAVFQLWRFFSHARRGLAAPLRAALDCQGIVVTVDHWLMMARNQAGHVLRSAHAMADAEGDILPEDRRDITFCPIEDVEFALQNGTGEAFLAACREAASGERKEWMLSVAHLVEQTGQRPYPFADRMSRLLPWMGRFGR